MYGVLDCKQVALQNGGYFGSALLDAIATRVVGVARFRPSRCL